MKFSMDEQTSRKSFNQSDESFTVGFPHLFSSYRQKLFFTGDQLFYVLQA